jgi:hypothetical protein
MIICFKYNIIESLTTSRWCVKQQTPWVKKYLACIRRQMKYVETEIQNKKILPEKSGSAFCPQKWSVNIPNISHSHVQNNFVQHVDVPDLKLHRTKQLFFGHTYNMQITMWSLYLDSVFDLTPTSLDVILDEDFLLVKLVEDFTPFVDDDFLKYLWIRNHSIRD